MQQDLHLLESRLAALYGKRSHVIKPGLARIEAALRELGEDMLQIPTVLVGGTNGKGSTAGFLWEMLVRSGLKVGLYTSPHLWRFAERIQVSGTKITEACLVEELVRLEQRLSPEVLEPLSFFEITTLLAWQVFQAAKVDLMVLEVGMGGRFDATNASRPLLSIVTSVALDHQQYLGSTTALIAAEKAGIMRPGCPVLWGGVHAGDGEVQAVMRAKAMEKGALLWSEGEHFGLHGEEMFLKLPSVSPWQSTALPAEVRTAPPFLKSNFAKSAAAYHYLQGRGLVSPHLEDILTGWDQRPGPLAPSRVGRFHRLRAAPCGFDPHALILDVGHNPAGAQALVAGLAASGLLRDGPIPGLVSILGDKDVNGILDILRPVLDPLFLFASASDRSFTRDMLAAKHADLPFYADVQGAWRDLALADPHSGCDRPWVITGSVYAIGEVFQRLGVDPLTDVL